MGPVAVLPIGGELGSEPGSSVKLSASLVDPDRSGNSALLWKGCRSQQRSGVIKMAILLLLLLPTPGERSAAECAPHGPDPCPRLGMLPLTCSATNHHQPGSGTEIRRQPSTWLSWLSQGWQSMMEAPRATAMMPVARLPRVIRARSPQPKPSLHSLSHGVLGACAGGRLQSSAGTGWRLVTVLQSLSRHRFALPTGNNFSGINRRHEVRIRAQTLAHPCPASPPAMLC